MNTLKYTIDELEKQLNLLELHLKQAPTSEEAFCQECVRKHISTIEGLAEEGIGFSENPQPFIEISNLVKEMKGKNIKEQGVELSKRTRTIRKKLSDCPECGEIFENPSGVEKLAKVLNISMTSNNLQTNNPIDNKFKGGKRTTMDFKDLGVINAGQFAGKGLIILADYVDTQTGKAGAPVFERYSTWINIAGGLALQVLAVKFLRGTSQFVAVVAGSHMLTKVVDYAREAAAPAARVRAVGAPVRVAARMAPTVAAPAAAPVALF